MFAIDGSMIFPHLFLIWEKDQTVLQLTELIMTAHIRLRIADGQLAAHKIETKEYIKIILLELLVYFGVNTNINGILI